MTIPEVLVYGGIAAYVIGLGMTAFMPAKSEWIGLFVAVVAAIAIVAGVAAGISPT